MYGKNLTRVPRVSSSSMQESAIEWQLAGRVAAAFMNIDKFGYTLTARIKVKKKHWWNRSWKVTSVHASTPDEAIKMGQEMLEEYGYVLDCDADDLEDWIRNQGNP